MKRSSSPTRSHLLLDFGIMFTAMTRGQARRNQLKREKEDNNGGKPEVEAKTTVQMDTFPDFDEDDEVISYSEESNDSDIRVGKRMIESIKALMESNKRLRTENDLLRQDIEVIQVLQTPDDGSCGDGKKKKKKRSLSR